MSFDNNAKEWDKNPQNIHRTNALADEINSFLPQNFGKGLEFGCGTGLLSFALKNKFSEITLCDTSKGMLDVLQEKIDNEKLTNFHPFFLDLSTENFEKETKFDVIYTSMTIHHIDNIEQIFAKFNSLLNKNGFLIIADLVKEDGHFHAPEMNFTGHFGFEKIDFEKALKSQNIEPIHYKIFYEIERKTENGKIKKYPLFLSISKKV